ncbi:hypothetical protein K0I73_12970 [Shewanella mesophila]|uniref:hypothetical protein n=1 Tax=Shewanella mesophila TaxID=2864208 RepID=UPI001C65C02D|nr:hypothetical protein [Shewanella mesophila]QYJ85129.1 hypothetical protein K0I73_12970 [Shewanella mesophila]
MKRFMHVALQDKQSLFSLFTGLVVSVIGTSATSQGHSGTGLMVVGASILSLAGFSLAASLHKTKQAIRPASNQLKAKEA